MKIKDSPECSYCEAVDNIAHFFVSCSHAYRFWELFSRWWSNKYHPKLTWPVFPSIVDILLGTTTDGIEQRALNYFIIQGKYFIDTKKLFHENNIEFMGVLSSLKYNIKIELMICKRDTDWFRKLSEIHDVLQSNLT